MQNKLVNQKMQKGEYEYDIDIPQKKVIGESVCSNSGSVVGNYRDENPNMVTSNISVKKSMLKIGNAGPSVIKEGIDIRDRDMDMSPTSNKEAGMINFHNKF